VDVTKSQETMVTKLNKITQRSYQDRLMKFSRLMPLVTPANLISCFNELDGNKAIGIDGKTKADYAKNLAENIHQLVKKMKALSYRPCAVREVLIPKANGKTRPLGISNIEGAHSHFVGISLRWQSSNKRHIFQHVPSAGLIIRS